MFLQDSVAVSKPLQIQTDDGRIHELPGAASLSEKIIHAPLRYVLDDPSAALITQAAFSEQSVTASCIDLLRFPARAFWMEWSEHSRAKLLEQYGLIDPFQELRFCKRAGVFTEADPSGRRGEMRILWENEAGEADLSPFVIEFDLDDAEFHRKQTPGALTRWLSIADFACAGPLLNHARFHLAEEWRAYYANYAPNPKALEEIIETSLYAIAGDFPYVASFCLVLAARGALQFSSTRLERLNASRIKNGKPPLLDHVTVSLELASDEEHGAIAGLSNRDAARLHHVCGHVVRRNGAIHWRRAHLRGNPQLGMVAARTVLVRAS